MSKKEKIEYKTIENFRELVEIYKQHGEKIAFKYKIKNKSFEVTYKQFADDIKALRNSNFEPKCR